ncbi:MAG: hypothetical protein IKZ59_06090 [Clostridia bacterium]|nr:hypothetical protein [Clostridia bacterium]
MKKIKLRLVCILLTFTVCVGVIFGAPIKAVALPKAQTRTVMFYLAGADLEENWGCATHNLVQVMDSLYNENLNFITMTGGARDWQVEAEYLDGAEAINAEYDQIWEVHGKHDGEEHGIMKLVEPTGIGGFEKADMSKPKTLTAFIDYCYENYPADCYDIILWDHGGGFASGYGVDLRFENIDYMTMAQIISAFGASRMIKDGKKFEIINFDACLMSGIEIAAALAPFTDYLVASPETEPGYGQEYTSWLDAVREKPEADGFEIGKNIVDGLKKYYDEEFVVDATLAVIDMKQFISRLMPKLTELDEILLNEAKTVGARNGRYNFYDEFYSVTTAFVYYGGFGSLYDFGNLVGSLSSPQSEMDNSSAEEIENLTNAYTDVALQILSILGDNDGSGDDVIYAGESEITNQRVNGYYIRGLDGEFEELGEDGYITVDPTGFSVYFGDGDINGAVGYVDTVAKVLKLTDDDATKRFFVNRALAAAYYTLLMRIGKIVSELSEPAEEAITWEDVCKYMEESQDADVHLGIDYLFKFIAEYDDDFESKEDVAEHFSQIVTQQAKEAISLNKIAVKKLIEADGSSNYYQVTVSDASAQSLMNVISAAEYEVGNYLSEVFNEIMNRFFGDTPADEIFTNGIRFSTEIYEGELDFNRYYEKFYEDVAELYRRLYVSTTSVWIVPKTESYCFVLTDAEGVVHPAHIAYRDRSKKRALVPIQLCFDDGGFKDANLSISLGDNGWEIEGLTFSDSDARSFFPMDSDYFIGARYSTEAGVAGSDGNMYMIPISQFVEIDITKENWGITPGWKRVEDVSEVLTALPHYFITDVYNYWVDVTDLFAAADSAAEEGDVARTLDSAEFSVAEAVYNGEEQTPEVTATFGGEPLTKDVDYKVLYDGSVEPGEAYAVVIGIGNYYGTLYLPYTIVTVDETVTVKVDGQDVGEENYTVKEDGSVVLKDGFLKRLAAGEHTLTVIKAGAQNVTAFTVPDKGVAYEISPQTGDPVASYLKITLTLMAFCLLTLAALRVKREQI